MKPKQAGALPEKAGYTKYFEHDGALRAYANRMMWFGISAVLISFVLALLVFYVRVQPPTVIRIAADGQATVVSGATTTPRTPLSFMAALAASSAPGEQPAHIDAGPIARPGHRFQGSRRRDHIHVQAPLAGTREGPTLDVRRIRSQG